MSSPILWGGNSTALNLENQILSANGTMLSYNGFKNYHPNSNFDLGLNGYAVGTIGTLTNGLPTATPTFNTTSTGLTTSAVAYTGFGGTQALQIVASSATAGGMVASPALAIDAEGQARVLQVKFSYTTVSGSPVMAGTSANTFAVAAYDVTNGAFIGMAGNFNFTQLTGVGQFVGTLQTAVNTASIRLCVYIATTGTATINIGNVVVGPQITAQSPAMTDWVAYTPTFTGFGTPTSVGMYSRRVGDSLQVRGRFTTGTTTAVIAGMTIGSAGANGNVTVDTGKISASGDVVGWAGANGNSTTTFGWDVISPNSAGSSTVNFGSQTSTTAGVGLQNANTMFASSQLIEVYFEVPIVGWSSNTASSADTDTRVIAFSVNNSTTAASTSTPVIFTAVSDDSAGGYNSSTGQYKVTVSGRWAFDATAFFGATTTGVSIYKNGVQMVQGVSTIASQSPGNAHWEGPCVAGDLFDVRPTSSATATAGSTFNIFSGYRLSGPAVVQAVESVNCSYTSTNGAAIGTSAAALVLNSKNYDSHSAYGASGYTCPVSGKYEVSAILTLAVMTLSTSQTVEVMLYKNGSFYAELGYVVGSGTSLNYRVIGSPVGVSCNAGDVLQLYAIAGTAVTLFSGAGYSHAEFKRIGN